MVLIFTGTEQLDKDLSKKIINSRVVYYPDYVLEEPEATVLIATVQNNKYNFKDSIVYNDYENFINKVVNYIKFLG